MSVMRLTTAALILCALLSCLQRSAAQEVTSREIAQAKTLFNAGAAAYELGDYAAAIQAFDAAYAITPLPAVAFSLAQAERRQYFVTHERSHLDRAIELYRKYLSAVETGGRRSDATDALAQLEPLAALRAPSEDTAEQSAEAARDRTRVMITSSVPGAQVSLDEAPPVAAPLIARVSPGSHQIVVSAKGHFPTERRVDAIPGELLPVEVSLREQPASITVRASPESDLQIDGRFVGRVGQSRRFELPGGQHRLTLSEGGHEVAQLKAAVAPGESRNIDVDLATTTQRKAAITMFIVGGGALVVGTAFAAVAANREDTAIKIDDERKQGTIDSKQLAEYADAKGERNRWRGIAITSFVAAFASGVTGLLLFLLDEPDLRETRDIELNVAVPGPGSPAASITGRVRF